MNGRNVGFGLEPYPCPVHLFEPPRCQGLLDEFVATGSLERMLLGELLNDVASLDGRAVLGNDGGEDFPCLLLALFFFELQLTMAVGRPVPWDGILVEFEH